MLITMRVSFLLIYLLITCGAYASTYDSYTLQSVNVVFRHGDRTPDTIEWESYPNDPYLNESFEPIGRGGLTNGGKRRMYELGARLRKLYRHFLSEDYKSSEIYAVSTGTNRTKMSLSLVLASLYAPTEGQKWNEDLDWQPVPIDAYAEFGNYLQFEACPTFVNELERVKNTSEYQKDAARFDELKKNLTILTGRDMSDLYQSYALYSTLAAESSMNLTLPDWTKPYFPEGAILDAALFFFKMESYTTSLKRLNGGLFIRKVLNENIYEKKEESRKLFLYSGHDSNIGGLLYALNLWNHIFPAYGSAVILEFYKNEDEHFIRTLWYNSITSEVAVQIIPRCAEFCPLKEFLRIVADILPDETVNSCLGPPEDSLFVPKSDNSVEWIYAQIKKWFNV